MEESPVSLIKKIKSDLLKDELLAKSNTEYKQINDKIINSKPYILNEIVEVNSTTTKVNDGKKYAQSRRVDDGNHFFSEHIYRNWRAANMRNKRGKTRN